MGRRRKVDCEQMRLELDAFDAPEATELGDRGPASNHGDEVRMDADALGEQSPLNGSDMRELLGEETFSEVSRAVGVSLGRAVWRQLRETGVR